MKNFLLAVLAGGLFGGLSSLALLPYVVDEQREIVIGGIRIPVQVRRELYAHDELMLAIFVASVCGAIVAFGMSWGINATARRRRRR